MNGLILAWNLANSARYIAIFYCIISSFQLCLMLLYMMFLYTMPLVVGVPHDAPEKLVKRLKFQGYFRILQAGFSFSIALLLLFSIINKLCDTFAVALALMLINFTYVSLHFAYSLTIALAKRKQESVIRNLLQILIVAPVCLYSFLVSMAYQNELCGSFYDNLPNFD